VIKIKLGLVAIFLTFGLPLQAKEISAQGSEKASIKESVSINNFQGEPQWRRPIQHIKGQVLSEVGKITALVVLAEDYLVASGINSESDCRAPFTKKTFNGEIVICQQSDMSAFVIAENLKNAGAGGLILQATQLGMQTSQQFNSLPSICLTLDSYFLLKNWAKYSKPGTTFATIGR
jgi:hypothetical protein